MILKIKTWNLFFIIFPISFVIFHLSSLKLSKDEDAQKLTTFYTSHRFYDPKLSRFTRADTIVPKPDGMGMNRYAYVLNCPFKYNDPTGHVPNDLLEEAKALYGDLADSGKSWLLAADHAAYVTVGMLAELVTLPEDDPVGLIVFLGTMGAGGAGAGSDDAARAARRLAAGKARSKGPPKALSKKDLDAIAARVNNSRTSELSEAVWSQAESDLAEISSNHVPLVRNTAYPFTPPNPFTAAEFPAGKYTILGIARQMDQLTATLSSMIGRQIRSSQPLGERVQLQGLFRSEAVEPVLRAWTENGVEGMEFTRSPFHFDIQRNQAIRRVELTYADENGVEQFTVTVREIFTDREYTRLLDHLRVVEGLDDLPPDPTSFRKPAGD